MSKVTFDISMSLDGFIAASHRTPEEPTGRGGGRLVEWAFGRDEANRRYLEGAVGGLGAVVAGRTTYDTSVPWWGTNGPSGDARRPVFVVTHQPPANSPENGVYEFVTGGIQEAVDRAREAADGQSVCVMGGADLGRQCIAAGLVDEISLHIVPVLFGEGTKLFEKLADDHIHLEPLQVVNTPDALHVCYQVLR